MKYCRTKTDIYELVKEDDDWVEIISNFERKMQCHCVIKKHAVIKQADTIEELCDEFVAMCDEYKKPFAWSNHHKDYFKEVKQFYDFWGKKNNKHLQFLYGAIWTDKGLIYVAKMNEKGDLELL